MALRGYGQHDPLVEYKREGLRLFKEMEKSIENSVANYLFYSLKEGVKNYKEGVQVQNPPGLASRPSLSNGGPSAISAVSEIGRNDSCPCGSGKKYKKCHGA